jgi:hypothetical protein
MTILAGMAGLKGPAVVENPDSWTGLLTSGLAGTPQIELHTKNQIPAKVREGLAATEDGRRVLRGSAPLDSAPPTASWC